MQRRNSGNITSVQKCLKQNWVYKMELHPYELMHLHKTSKAREEREGEAEMNLTSFYDPFIEQIGAFDSGDVTSTEVLTSKWMIRLEELRVASETDDVSTWFGHLPICSNQMERTKRASKQYERSISENFDKNQVGKCFTSIFLFAASITNVVLNSPSFSGGHFRWGATSRGATKKLVNRCMVFKENKIRRYSHSRQQYIYIYYSASPSINSEQQLTSLSIERWIIQDFSCT